MIASWIEENEITQVQSHKDISEEQQPCVRGRELPEHGKFAQIQRLSEARTDMRREARKLLEPSSRYFGPHHFGNHADELLKISSTRPRANRKTRLGAC
jgi:hypothetical protein